MPSAIRILPDPPEIHIERALGLVAFLAHRHLFDHLRRLSGALDTDIESVMVWSTLMQLNVANSLLPGVDALRVLTDDGDVPAASIRPVRLSHLSQVSGLPRETVRRKLDALRAHGRVERSLSGGWQFRPDGIDLPTRALMADSVRGLLAVADQIRQALGRVHGS